LLVRRRIAFSSRFRRLRLGHEVLGAVAHGNLPHLRIVERGHDDDRRVGGHRPDGAAYLQPIHVGHHQVHDQDLRPQISDGLNRLGPVGHAGDHVARRLEHACEGEPDVWMIVGQHDSRPAKFINGSRVECSPSVIGYRRAR
jgi:hypothetical protein